jgi:hypothetical protein
LNNCIAQYAADTHKAMNNKKLVISGRRFIVFLPSPQPSPASGRGGNRIAARFLH